VHGCVVYRQGGEKIKLVGVLFILYIKDNIISLGKMDENGYKVVIEKGVLRI
jgi:hypothetical protein